MKRIRRLLCPARPNSAWTPLFAALAPLLIAAVTLAAWQTVPTRRSAAGAQAKAGAVETSAYVRWLDEDVVYIIENRERAAFQALTTDAERHMFIEQFWQRRDPTPGAQENAFKKEHYRRKAYANQHFAMPGTAGWRTDRGHMYIVYGPPDEIESHPKGAQHPYAIDMWAYRHVDGIPDRGYFTFIDRTGQGDYRLAPGNVR
jgi:GWxTD domain-containing protein